MGLRDTLLQGQQILRTPTGTNPPVTLILTPCDFDANGTFTGYTRTPRMEMSIEYNVTGRAFIRGNPYLKHNFSWQLQLDAVKFQRLQTLVNIHNNSPLLGPGLTLEDGFQPVGVGVVGNGEISTITTPSGATIPEGSLLSVYNVLITSVSYDWIRNGLYSVKMDAQEL